MRENKKEYVIITTCPFCGHTNEVAVNEADYWDWQDGALVQNAFPYLTADEREMLVSGICPDCWDKMFSEDPDEVEEDYEPDYDLDMGFDPYMGCYSWDC